MTQSNRSWNEERGPGVGSPGRYDAEQDPGPEYPGRGSEYQGSDGHGGSGTMDRAREQAGEQLNTMKEQAGEQFNTVREQAGEQMEQGRERVAEGTHMAAERVREQAESRGGMQGKVGTRAADTMEQAAGYLREHKSEEIWSDMERYAKEHPVQAVGGAVLAGFVLGRVLR